MDYQTLQAPHHCPEFAGQLRCTATTSFFYCSHGCHRVFQHCLGYYYAAFLSARSFVDLVSSVNMVFRLLSQFHLHVNDC